MTQLVSDVRMPVSLFPRAIQVGTSANSRIDLGNQTFLEGLTTFSYSIWTYLNPLQPSNKLLGYKYNFSSNLGYVFSIVAGRRASLATGNIFRQSPVNSLPAEGWHNIGFSVDFASNFTLYVDGQVAWSTSASGFSRAGQAGMPVVIGNETATGLVGSGNIVARARLWNRVLTDTEFAKQLRGPAPAAGLLMSLDMQENTGVTAADSSGNNVNGVLAGTMVPTWVAGLDYTRPVVV